MAEKDDWHTVRMQLLDDGWAHQFDADHPPVFIVAILDQVGDNRSRVALLAEGGGIIQLADDPKTEDAGPLIYWSTCHRDG